ncbi:glycosyltransferase family 4 protein [Rhodobacter capsulatus]|jgi:N,N'-diacetylbacillosaminyl-diphospho-undecaprenol alpha-1,3-N-acetylgalactosaminyltransferase|uniref:Glycosyl transferase, group 1 n=1 Tax=Rhodobacter capsulatus (strain ATCC BAA-309 / NBRC 16581 / SB1003) TaxID=272942 RepID=D5AR35_RHOCB|nr:glycosyltransferase family 4 protein [Rhodobacter capsulatus]ADE84841.1 glycosyl transferase, group 1 [Rhodobacter capsulatus SB 1003]ETD02287.1 glycosyl transferase family 1 [Rhodobacter capsulatus DE442]ETD77578.1 glycosyl transferase family 1 [Rhodobacter capsulatus R121]ETE54228.1 glycosyl transferase family 1 [Rhodobacter capsulatus Y262]MDS0925757.1 glycosyltransferase family 4 protein [Rhodobacter capsulatus]
MKVVLVCNTDGALANFRAPLIRALVAAGHEVVTISGSGGYIDTLRAMGARPIVVEFSRHSAAPLRNLGLLRDLLRLLRQERPDVVHCFTHKAVIFGSLAARLAGGSKIVATVTGLGTLFVRGDAKTRLLKTLLVWQYRLLLRPDQPVLFQNPDDLQEMVSLRAVRRKQAVLTYGSGIDLAEYALPDARSVAEARQQLAQETGQDMSNRIIALFPARGVPEKGFKEFYAAARTLSERFPGRFAFVHIGLIDTEASGALSAEEVRANALAQGVHYLGYKINARDYMTAADVVVLPSYYREGVPRSLIEALALGKCLVTTDMPGCRETLIDGWNGFLCGTRDAASVVSALERIDADFRETARPRSRQLCEDRFDVRRLNALTFGLYGLPAPEAAQG